MTAGRTLSTFSHDLPLLVAAAHGGQRGLAAVDAEVLRGGARVTLAMLALYVAFLVNQMLWKFPLMAEAREKKERFERTRVGISSPRASNLHVPGGVHVVFATICTHMKHTCARTHTRHKDGSG